MDGIGSGLGDEDLLFADIPSVFKASKYEQKVTEAPARISIVMADEIQRYGYRTSAEAAPIMIVKPCRSLPSPPIFSPG